MPYARLKLFDAVSDRGSGIYFAVIILKLTFKKAALDQGLAIYLVVMILKLTFKKGCHYSSGVNLGEDRLSVRCRHAKCYSFDTFFGQLYQTNIT